MLGVLLSIHIWSVRAPGHTSGSAAIVALPRGAAVGRNLESRADPVETNGEMHSKAGAHGTRDGVQCNRREAGCQSTSGIEMITQRIHYLPVESGVGSTLMAFKPQHSLRGVRSSS
jgi:hypothetical protein